MTQDMNPCTALVNGHVCGESPVRIGKSVSCGSCERRFNGNSTEDAAALWNQNNPRITRYDNRRVQEIYDRGGHLVSVHQAELVLGEEEYEVDEEPLYFVAYVPLPRNKTMQGYKGDTEQEAAICACTALRELKC